MHVREIGFVCWVKIHCSKKQFLMYIVFHTNKMHCVRLVGIKNDKN